MVIRRGAQGAGAATKISGRGVRVDYGHRRGDAETATNKEINARGRNQLFGRKKTLLESTTESV